MIYVVNVFTHTGMFEEPTQSIVFVGTDIAKRDAVIARITDPEQHYELSSWVDGVEIGTATYERNHDTKQWERRS